MRSAMTLMEHRSLFYSTQRSRTFCISLYYVYTVHFPPVDSVKLISLAVQLAHT